MSMLKSHDLKNRPSKINVEENLIVDFLVFKFLN